VQGATQIPRSAVITSPVYVLAADATTVSFEFRANGAGTYRIRDFGIEIVRAASAYVTGQKAFVDFGPVATRTTGQADVWTQHSFAGGASCEIVRTNGSLTTSTLPFTTSIFQSHDLGVNNSTGYPANAKRDGYFGDNATPNLTCVLNALDPSKTYRFTFFGSRNGVGDIRSARYTVIGANSGSGDLDGSNNSTNVVTVTGIQPSANGEITINSAKAPSNNNGSGFYYLNFVQMEVE
jgi:hypothetical protein